MKPVITHQRQNNNLNKGNKQVQPTGFPLQ